MADNNQLQQNNQQGQQDQVNQGDQGNQGDQQTAWGGLYDDQQQGDQSQQQQQGDQVQQGQQDDQGQPQGDQGQGLASQLQREHPQLTSQEIARIVAQTMQQSQEAQQQQARGPKSVDQMTDEELQKTFQLFNASEQHLQRLGLEPTPERVAAMNEMLQSISRQAVTVAGYQLEQIVNQLNQQYAPALQVAQQMQLQQQADRFFNKYPQFKGYDDFLIAIRDRMVAEGNRFDTEDQAFDEVAKRATSMLQKMNVNLQAVQQGGQQGGQQTPPNNGQQGQQPGRMPALSRGGQGGVGNSGQGGTKPPGWADVFQ